MKTQVLQQRKPAAPGTVGHVLLPHSTFGRLQLTGHLVISSGHSWGSSEEGSSHTLHEPKWLEPLSHGDVTLFPKQGILYTLSDIAKGIYFKRAIS